MTTAPGTAPACSIGEHLRRTLALAFPVMLGRIGILLLVAVDTAMTGHGGARELAYYALANAPQVPLLLVGIGLLLGTVVLTAQADGAGDTRTCGRIWRVAMAHGGVLGLLLLLICYAGEHFLLLTGQTPELALGAARVLVVLGWGLPGMLLFTATTLFLEGMNRPLPGMLVILAGNLLNLALNWVLIFGNLGAPAMGAEGAALATSIVRWFMCAAIAWYAWTHLDHERYGLTGPATGDGRVGRRLRRLGLPMGIAHGLEAAAFSTLTLFAGRLGPLEVSGYAVAMNLVALAFMGAVGFATAASVRVGNAVGRRDAHGVRVSGWVAVGSTGVIMVALGSLLFLFPGPLAATHASDPRILAVAIPTMMVAAVALIPDGIQAVLIGALRGAADVWPAMLLYLLSFWGVMVPCGYYLALVRYGGAPSLMASVAVGTLTATILLGLRFHAVSGGKLAKA
jgi:MATE family multidrug resistance protein